MGHVVEQLWTAWSHSVLEDMCRSGQRNTWKWRRKCRSEEDRQHASQRRPRGGSVSESGGGDMCSMSHLDVESILHEGYRISCRGGRHGVEGRLLLIVAEFVKIVLHCQVIVYIIIVV